ncbi:MAG: PTS sugar transporter subunit IIA [Treponema sp.]
MLSSFLKPQTILVDIESSDKDSLFAELLETLVRSNPSIDRTEAMDALIAREEQMNTCICKGVAVPHAVCDSASDAVVALGISRKGIDYGIDFDSGGLNANSFDDSLVHIVIMMLGGRENTAGRLNILTSCADILRKPGFCSDIMSAKSADDVMRTIWAYEND